MNMARKRIYRIQEIEIDTAQGCLRREGRTDYLRQKTFSVLLYLLDQRHRVVRKEELIDSIWLDTAISDDGLVQCIVEIRKALGDDSRDPRFIKTIPKVGYRFIGPVEEVWSGMPVSGGGASVTIEELATEEIQYEEEIEIEEPALDGAPKSLPSRILQNPHWQSIILSSAIMVGLLISALLIYSDKALLSRRSLSDVQLPKIPGKKALAVMYLENQSGSSDLNWMRAGLADMLITDLSRSRDLIVLSRQQLSLLMGRAGYKEGEIIPLDQAREIAQKINAETVVLGNFAKLGEKVRIDVQLHDASNGHLVKTESLVVDRPDEIFTQIDLLALNIASDLGTPPSKDDSKRRLSDVMTNNLEAYRYYSLALEKAHAYHNAEAISLLEKAIAMDPQFAMAHARIGYTYVVTWNLAQKAKPYLEMAFRLSHRLTEKDRLYITAWYALANLDYSGAIQTFRKIIAEYPIETEAYLRLGYLLRGEELSHEAIDVLKQGLVVDSEAKDIYNALGGTYSELGRHHDAISMQQRYVALAPDEPNAHDSLAMAYEWAGQYQEAIEEYNRALALNPDFEIALRHLGNTEFQLGRYSEALRRYQRCIQIVASDYERSNVYGLIAWVYWKKGNLKEAQEAAENELRLQTTAVTKLLFLALQGGDWTAAERLKKLVNSPSPYTSRGRRPTARGRYYVLGMLEMKSGRESEAVAHFKEALRSSPPTYSLDSFEDCLANAYLQLRRSDEAIAEYRRILRLNPNYPLAHFHLGQAYEQLGKHSEAGQEYEKLLHVWKNADADVPEIIAAKKRVSGYRSHVSN